ncbi:hypothetical protein ACFFLM_22810 [Deinococcus oregonensis]|uniref:Uncharacterized protein n=1 Tax=Deinococcus oregonensis TaxID=1805970 RepID=A0ABV6B768_9DEIO
MDEAQRNSVAVEVQIGHTACAWLNGVQAGQAAPHVPRAFSAVKNQVQAQPVQAFGAVVTGVCSAVKVNPADALAADEVIASSKTDLAQVDARQDLVLDIGGNRPWRSFSAC